MTNNTASIFRKYVPLVLFGLMLVALPVLLRRLWLFQPILLILFSLLATQIGSMCAKTILHALAKNLPPDGEPPLPGAVVDEDLKRKGIELNQIIKARAEQSNQPAATALESFMSQVIGTWGMVVLTIGLTIVLFCREYFTGIPNPTWVVSALFIILVVVAGWIIGLIATSALWSKPIIEYYGRHTWYPPKGNLTYFRIAMLLVYSFLVVVAHWPNPNLELRKGTSYDAKTDMETNRPTIRVIQ